MLDEMKYFIFFLFGYCFYSCQSFEERQLAYALDFAGENRKELEKVLDYYAKDPLRLEAARFLIRNMPRYYGYEGWRLDSIQRILITAEQKHFINDSIVRKWTKQSLYALPKIYDAHVIKADYLIENIDLSFKMWKECPWNQDLPFEDFCELILPYRIDDEPLSNWRLAYFNTYFSSLDSFVDCTDPLLLCNTLSKELSKKEFFYTTDFDMPHLSARFLLTHHVGFCREMCDQAVYAMRACGIPVTVDMFVYSPEYQGSHQWNVVRGKNGHFYPFWTSWYEMNNNKKGDGRKKGKVYRQCFGMQKEAIKGITSRKNVPPLFKNRFIKDVTVDYTGTNKIAVKVETEDPYIYLGVFSPDGWIPIDIGENIEGYVTFYNVEQNLIYQTLHSNDNSLKMAGYPFLYTQDTIHYFIPKTGCTEQIALLRKMSLTKGIKSFLYRYIIGSEIEGSKSLSFKNPIKLLTLQDTLTTNYNEFATLDTFSIRYIRYNSPLERPIELAEISFWEDLDMREEIPVKIINNLMPLHPANSIDKINDKDILSFFESQDTTCCLLFDIGKEISVKKIVLSPRNDDNYIWPGDEYELFYNDGINGWFSLGKQVAKERVLYYNVPVNALFWLRNLSKGKEEQVFFYRNNIQHFVTNLP